MIIQIAGTSGSGKTHLVKQFMTSATFAPQYQEGRVSPLGYLATIPGVDRDVYVPGSYLTPTGGCDTLKNIKVVFDLVNKVYGENKHVVFEGLFCMNQTRGPQLAEEIGRQFCVLHLQTPLATCLKSINIRRSERGVDDLLAKENTVNNYTRATNYAKRMRGAGARVIKIDRADGLAVILGLLEE